MSKQKDGEMVAATESHSISDKSIEWLSAALQKAINLVAESNDKIEILDEGGNVKKYTPVAVRNAIFRQVFGVRGRILTRPREEVGKDVVMESVVDFLMDGKYVRYANAFAGKTQYEMAQNQNGKSIIQLAETASIGRVLANIGLSGGEFASLEDLVDYKKEKISTSDMVATKKQIEIIKANLKEKNLTLKEDFPLIDGFEKISYQRANDLIAEIDETEEKKTTQKKKSPIKVVGDKNSAKRTVRVKKNQSPAVSSRVTKKKTTLENQKSIDSEENPVVDDKQKGNEQKEDKNLF